MLQMNFKTVQLVVKQPLIRTVRIENKTIIPESEKPDAAHQNELSDSSITYQKEFATANMVTSTPSTPIKLTKSDLYPQERVIQHSQSLNVKLETKNNKSSSCDKISNEMLTNGTQGLINPLVKLFNLIFKSVEFPRIWIPAY